MRTEFACLLLCAFLVEILSEAPKPPACPTLPRPNQCRTGVADQCTKDADCPTFIRCCSDGCSKRCIDTSSKLAVHAMRSKYGSCLRPAMNKCSASSDLCFDDSYCMGDEKCCIDTDCGKKCMLPDVLQKIKNTTKAFSCPHVKSDGKKCPDKPKHYCSMDSECPTYTTCCFDGCRKRCTDRQGKRVSNTPGYLCPILPPPVACPNAFKECRIDNDCIMGMKCCSDSCNFWCMPSYPPPAETIYKEPVPTDPSLRKLHKPGKCPVLAKPKSCYDQIFQCNYDVDCWNSDKKCCDNGCVTTCVDPVSSTTPYVKLMTTETIAKTSPTHRRRTLISTQEKLSSKRPPTKKLAQSTWQKPRSTTTQAPTPPTPKVTTPPITQVPTPRSTTEKLSRKVTTSSKYEPDIPTGDTKVVIFNKDGIRINPESTEAVTGQRIQVTCTIKGEPFEGWYTPKGLKITSEQDSTMYVRGRGYDYTLVINNVEQMHGGKYTCRGAFSSSVYDLYIKLFIVAPENKQFLQAGTTGIIEVSTKGYPRPKSTWLKDDQPVRLSSGRYSISPSGSLIIKDVRLADKGHYSIIANHYYMKTNPGLYSSMVGSSDSADITVDVLKGNCPMPKTRRCVVGQRDECANDDGCRGSFICCTDGCRQRCVQQGNKETNQCPYILPPFKCSSSVKECTSDKQCSGNKKCCSDSCHFRCIASQSSNSEIIPGVQTYPNVERFCNPNQSIRLICRVDKQPFEGWFDSYNRKVVPETHGSRMMVENHHEYQVLVIKNVTAMDGGKYTCQGALDSATVDVGVNQTIDKYEHPMMLYPGKPGLFLQNIQCYPPPRFIWYKRGKPLDLSSDRYSVSPSGSLGIRRIRSTDMGVYTLKLQMGSAMKETGVKVAAAVDGVDFTEWQDSLAPGATVRCHKDVMYIDLDKKVLKGYDDVNLSLLNSSCRASSNKTHYTLKASLVECGTVAQFTKEAVVYSNVVQEYRTGDMITRLQDIKIPFSCFYTKAGVTSTFGLLPSKVRRVMDGGNVTTKFELGMTLYRDESYSVSFGIGDFPLRVTVNRPLFVQVKIDSPDSRLRVMADRCYATPTQDPRHPMQYDIINDGCRVDPTVEFYKGPNTVQRFSFKAFQFLAKGKTFVYLHCSLIVCNVSDTTSRCALGCLSSSFGRRLRRHQTSSAEVELTQGPFLLDRKSTALAHESGSSFKDYIWIMIGMAGFCILCLIAMVYMKRQINRRHSDQQQEPDLDRETYL